MARPLQLSSPVSEPNWLMRSQLISMEMSSDITLRLERR